MVRKEMNMKFLFKKTNNESVWLSENKIFHLEVFFKAIYTKDFAIFLCI